MNEIADRPQGLVATTMSVLDTEPCFMLREENRMAENGKQLNRYQILTVVRNDRLVRAYVNLGRASQFNADEFQLVGGVLDDEGKGEAVHTVAELREGAEELRSRPTEFIREPSNLAERYVDHMEEMNKQRSAHSTFGAKSSIVRA